MKNNDLVVAPSRNGILSSVSEFKHQQLVNTLNELSENGSNSGCLLPFGLNGSLSYECIVRLSNRVKIDLFDEYYGNVCSVKTCRKINEWGGVLVPVIWHQHRNLEGAVHVYLQGEKRSWVYLNMELSTPEYLFAALRELGRMLTVSTTSKESSEWASRLFATNILLSESVASDFYYELVPFGRKLSNHEKVNNILRFAIERKIFPLAVLWRLNEFALSKRIEPLDVEELLMARLGEFDTNCVKEVAELFEHVVMDDEPINMHHYSSVLKYLGSDFLDIFNKSSSSMSELESSKLGNAVTNMYNGIFTAH